MKIKCGANGEDLDESKIFVCHHCGMPVCEEHGWVVASDDAFAGWAAPPPGAVTPPGAVAPTPRPAGSVLRSATTVPPPAMHCRDCVDKFHGGATKRHGWVDYRPGAVGFPGSVGRP